MAVDSFFGAIQRFSELFDISIRGRRSRWSLKTPGSQPLVHNQELVLVKRLVVDLRIKLVPPPISDGTRGSPEVHCQVFPSDWLTRRHDVLDFLYEILFLLFVPFASLEIGFIRDPVQPAIDSHERSVWQELRLNLSNGFPGRSMFPNETVFLFCPGSSKR